MYDEIPIRIYSIVQTIGKIKAGGLKSGLLSDEYIVTFLLNSEDKDPAARGMSTEMIKELVLWVLFMCNLRLVIYTSIFMRQKNYEGLSQLGKHFFINRKKFIKPNIMMRSDIVLVGKVSMH